MKPANAPVVNNQPSDEQFWGTRPLIWGFRMLEPDAQVALEGFTPGECREVAAFLGLACNGDKAQDGMAARLAAAAVVRQRTLSPVDSPSVLDTNLRHLKAGLGLENIDLDLIAFRAMIDLHPGFDALAGKYFGVCADFVFHRKLATLLGVTVDAVTSALAPASRIVRNGLLEVSSDLGSICHRLWVMCELIRAMTMPAGSPVELLQRLLPPARDARLPLSAYPHLDREIKLLSAYLGRAVGLDSGGANVLLYGKPGNGKTELAAALAAKLQRPLYVAPAAADGRSLMPRDRILQLIQLQRLVHATVPGVILVDEAESLFPTGWSDPEKVPSKAAVNECLESNPTPTIWISNRTEHMDEAFLRRFDLVVNVPPLPAPAKRKLLSNALPPGTLDDHELRRFAKQRELSPAMIARIARVATSGHTDDTSAIRDNLFLLSGHYLRTMGATAVATRPPVLLPHDPELLNIEPPIATVLEGMRASALGVRMLLHGQPGTGKSALGKAIADKLDKPLLQFQASSLLSSWVGGTERNLRSMFDEARAEDAVLLLDEADSFLRRRDQARASWEVTQVNELLVGMEAFEGTFVCTTNRLDDLDPAALRRFDFKLEFRSLRFEQRIRLIHLCCAALGIEMDGAANLPDGAVRQLDGLTPGDAVTALRRLAATVPSPTLHDLMGALATECRYKPEARHPIGFRW